MLMEALALKDLPYFILFSTCPEWVVKDMGYMGCIVYCPRTLAQQHRVNTASGALEVSACWANLCNYMHNFEDSWCSEHCPRSFIQALFPLPEVFCFLSLAGSFLFLMAHTQFSFALPDLSQSLNAVKGFWQRHWSRKVTWLFKGTK